MYLTKEKKVQNKYTKAFLVALGSFFVGLGVIGIFLPVLPTTPFLLLAAACYARASEKFYKWLVNHKVLGSFIRHYREKTGVPVRVKFGAITLLWIGIGSSAIFFVDNPYLDSALIIIAIGVTIHLLTLKTRVNGKSD